MNYDHSILCPFSIQCAAALDTSLVECVLTTNNRAAATERGCTMPNMGEGGKDYEKT